MLLVQAYTVELEAELNHLKEENERLRAEEVLGTETFFFWRKRNRNICSSSPFPTLYYAFI